MAPIDRGRRHPLGLAAGALAATLSTCAMHRDGDAPTREPRAAIDTPLDRGATAPRVAAWAAELAPIDVASGATRETSRIRLYASDGEVDDEARSAFERIAACGGDAHPLDRRVEQLVFLAAYRFKGAPVVIVSGWRDHASRHGTGEAIDFKLKGVRASVLAAYLRRLPRVGVGIYTHPRTQFVHLDVREPSFHWMDASPPGVHWRERQLRDPHVAERDASWTLEMDLP